MAFAVGDALGAVILAAAVSLVGEPVVAWIQEGETAALWERIAAYIDALGLLVLGGLAVTPLPARIATAVLALTGTTPLLIGLVVLGGRLFSYPAVAYVAAHAPARLMRFRLLARWLRPRVSSTPPSKPPMTS
ncbi:MAG: hypothetical protein D6685_18410 [Bacteroidetes bacterium]|nr:MAG: hypothetical protein D6685_18410 [Bacteroidota bacterium]